LKVIFSKRASDDYDWWKAHDGRGFEKINELIRAIRLDPHRGIGKPEPLKENLSGWWSRRITKEHRLVYKVENGAILVAQCRFHY
jgi:toxin YoeB